MYKIDISDKASRDLNKIIVYITEVLCAPQATSDFLDDVDDCYERLENNPYIFEECRDTRLQQMGYRRAVIKNYIMLYRIHSASHVIVHHFFYGGQDYINLV